MITVEKLIEELEKVENKQMEVVARRNSHITNVIDTFECEADGVCYICIDCEDK